MTRLDKKGMTLVEVSVACSVMVILAGIMSLLVIKSFAVNRYSIEQGLNTAFIQNTLTKFSKHLREARQSDEGGYLIESAEDFDLVFYANVDADPAIERVHYFLENTQLKIGISEASGFPPKYSETDQLVNIIGNGIVNTQVQPIFYYYESGYYGQVNQNAIATPATPAQIGLVKIDLYVNTDPGNMPENTHMETFIRPRNIKQQ
ncbi:MAG: prepilin-type N-terminal cleavage/methylation domain-containing protein [Candidatus Moranbacteria bacterium]|nr:prepilin-type N-terminal cleavage/methylation domain-containing protein [Candidatus Moranbacteria bacterium]